MGYKLPAANRNTDVQSGVPHDLASRTIRERRDVAVSSVRIQQRAVPISRSYELASQPLTHLRIQTSHVGDRFPVDS